MVLPGICKYVLWNGSDKKRDDKFENDRKKRSKIMTTTVHLEILGAGDRKYLNRPTVDSMCTPYICCNSKNLSAFNNESGGEMARNCKTLDKKSNCDVYITSVVNGLEIYLSLKNAFHSPAMIYFGFQPPPEAK